METRRTNTKCTTPTRKATGMSTDRIITFNVGGRSCATYASTLAKFPNTMLSRMVSGSNGMSLKKDENGNYFIDRPAEEFEQVLSYYRDGIVPSNLALCLYWGFVEGDMVDITQGVCLIREKAMSFLDSRLTQAKQWVRRMMLAFPLSQKNEPTSLKKFLVYTGDAADPTLPEKWFEGLSQPEIDKLKAAYPLKFRKTEADSIHRLWQTFREEFVMRHEQRTIIKCILRRIGCRRVKWSHFRYVCICERGYDNANVIERKSPLRPISIYPPIEGLKKRSYDIGCPRMISKAITDVLPSHISECPDLCWHRYCLKFKLCTSRDYDAMLML